MEKPNIVKRLVLPGGYDTALLIGMDDKGDFYTFEAGWGDFNFKKVSSDQAHEILNVYLNQIK